MKTFLLLVFLTAFANAEILQLNRVVEKLGLGITRHEFGGEEKQVVFVEDKGFITEKDVKFASPSLTQEDAIDVTLTPAGTEKMIAATAIMRAGIDRIAIILNGKVFSAPVVQMVPLGKNFMISGLEEKDEPLKFAGLLSGKSEDEIADYIAAEKVRIANLPKPPPPIYHTDEEYQQLAIQREKLGLHYMDRTYTEEKLEELLTPGMILAEVTGIFGKANRVSRKDNGDWELTFETASEKFPIEEEFHLNSFNTLFSDGKLVSWNPYGSSKQTRTPKPPQSKPQPTNLEITVPPADMSSEDFDFITFVEEYKISLKPGKTQPTKSDALTLANLLFSVCSGSEKDQTIASQCDLISILAKKIPEVAAFVKNSKGGKIPTKALGKALEPYIFAGKALK